MRNVSELEVGGQRIPVSNLDKVLYPRAGFTKGQVIDYYIRISPVLLPHLKNHPLTLKRYPNGVEAGFFYEKQCPTFRPKWVEIAPVRSESQDKTIHYCLANDLRSLVWAANLADLELHTSLATYPKVDQPRSMVFDLDPGAPADALDCARVALRLKEKFDALGLVSLVKTSGSKGLQLYVPLNSPVTYDDTKSFSKRIAEELEREDPERVVARMSKALRGGKVFIDWSQNDRHKTTVSVYSLRARERPTVSTPLSWTEVASALRAKDVGQLVFEAEDALERVEKQGDLFEPLLSLKQKLRASLENSPGKVSRRSALTAYAGKRDFERTSEPRPQTAREHGSAPLFVIQKHAASHLHYDFRLEVEGVLKSWAVPKGPPFERGDRRLAMRVEDHPLDYARFEGVIPEGNYGAGTVMVWDIGTFEAEGGASKGLAAGKLHLTLHGKKLKGKWTLVKMRGGKEMGKDPWLLMKGGEGMKPLTPEQDDQSALSRRTMSAIAGKPAAEWQSNRPSAKRRRSPLTARRSPTIAVPGELPQGKLEFIEPMYCRLAQAVPEGAGWEYEVKFDGIRALAIKNGSQVQLISRLGNSVAERFPEITAAVAGLPCEKAMLDGEVVALEPSGRSSFQLLQMSAMPGRRRPPIRYYIFDALNLEGKDLKSVPLTGRKEILQKLLPEDQDLLRLSASLKGDPRALLEQVRERGMEGLVAKRANSIYEPGRRSGAWQKIKCVRRQEFVIGGYTTPRGTRTHFGALLVGYHEGGRLLFASKVGTGFDQELLRNLYHQLQTLRQEDCPFDNLPERKAGRYGQGLTSGAMKLCAWVRPEMVCEIVFNEWTLDGHLRQPVFAGLREDKRAEEVTRES